MTNNCKFTFSCLFFKLSDHCNRNHLDMAEGKLAGTIKLSKQWLAISFPVQNLY